MSLKRGAFEQGGKDTGIDTGAEDKASEPVRKATTAQMRARNIKQPKGRLHGTRSATPPNFALQAIGNPFSTADPNTVNNTQANSTNATNKPPNSAFTFGGGNTSTQSFPPSNNIENQQPIFGASSQNNSFPSTQQSNPGTLFGNIAPSAGFTFGNAFNTNNPFAQKPTDPPPSNQPTSQPDSSTSSFFNFGKTPEVTLDQNQNPHTQNENSASTNFSQIFQATPKGDTQHTPKDNNKDEDDMVDFNNTLWQSGSKPGTFGSKGLQRPPPTPVGLARPDPVDPPPTYQYSTSSSPSNTGNGANQNASDERPGKRRAQEAGHYSDGYQAYEDEARGRDPTPRSQINSTQNASQGSGSALPGLNNGFGSAINNSGLSNRQNGFGTSSGQPTGFGTSNQQDSSGTSTGHSNGFGTSSQQGVFGNSSSQSHGFGAPNQQSGFGVSNQQSGFGTPSRQINGFGNPTPKPQGGLGSSSSAQGDGFGPATQTNSFATSNQTDFGSADQAGTSGGSTQPSLPGIGNWGSSDSNNASSMSQSNEQQVGNNAQSNSRPSSSAAATTGFGPITGASSQNPSQNPFGQPRTASLFGNNNVFGQSQERQQQQANPSWPHLQPSSQNTSSQPVDNDQSMSDDRQQTNTMGANAGAEPTSPNHDMHDADGAQRQDDIAQNLNRRANPSAATQQDAQQAPAQKSTPHASVQQTSLHFPANQNSSGPQPSAVQSAPQTASQKHAVGPPTSAHHNAPQMNTTQTPELRALAYIRLKKLNVGLLNHMQLQDINDDWSEICSGYISQRDKILNASGIDKSLKRKSDFEDASPSKRSAIGTYAPAAPSTASSTKPQSKTADLIENIVAQPSASNTPLNVNSQASSQAPEQQSSHLFTPQPRRQISQGTDLFSEKLAASTQRSETPRDGSPRRVLPTPDEKRRNSAAEETSNKPNPFAQVQPSRTPTPSSPTRTSTQPFSNGSTSTKKQSTIGNAGEEELADYEDSDDGQTLEEEMKRQKSSSNPNAGKSLFDRITTPARDNASEDGVGQGKATATPRPLFGQTTAATTNLFGTSGATPSNLFGAQASSGDRTWKGQEHSPINFSTSMNGTPAGATAAAPSLSKDTTSSAETRPFGSLFGTPKPDTTPSLFGQQSSSRLFQNPTLQPPTATPSLFSGSANASRATTPGMSVSNHSDAGNDTNDEDAEAPLAQADLTAPSEEELSQDDIIHEVPRVRLMQYRPDKPKDGSPWLVIATGPLRLMKNKSTGSVRVVVRGDLRGNVVLNATLQEGMTFSKKQKCVVSFGAPDTEGVMRGWHVKVGKDDVADNLLRMLQTATPEEL